MTYFTEKSPFLSRDLLIAYLIQQFISSSKVLLTNSNILLCKRHWTITRIKEEKAHRWIHSQKLCNLCIRKTYIVISMKVKKVSKQLEANEHKYG